VTVLARRLLARRKLSHVDDQPNFDADRFDVAAKADSPASVDQLRLMLQALLADRFKLVIHVEERQADVYALRLARADGKLGPNLHPATEDCRTLLANVTDPAARKGACGTIGTAFPPWHLKGVASTQLLIFRLELGRPIIDKTDLAGPFDFDLNWTPRWALAPGFDAVAFPRLISPARTSSPQYKSNCA
jgi:uncharacterized protein (TIGR03435 family)